MAKASCSIDQVTQSFKALADPTRLRLLALLLDGERCVCELVDVIEEPQPKVSRHLAYLRKAELVLTRRDGLWIHYRLADTHSDFAAAVIESVRQAAAQIPELREDHKRLKKTIRVAVGAGKGRCD